MHAALRCRRLHLQAEHAHPILGVRPVMAEGEERRQEMHNSGANEDLRR